MIATLLTIIAPVFITAGIGFVWARLGRRFDVDMVTLLVTNVGAPCLVFHTLANLKISAIAFGEVALATAAVMAVTSVVGAAGLFAAGLSRRAFLPVLMFPNSGNMGLPLCLLAFGDVGLALAIGVFTTNMVGNFTVGVALASGSVSWRNLAKVPVLYVLPVAIAFMVTGTTPPTWVNATTELVGALTIPLMLITLGVSLAKLTVRSLGLGVALAVGRLALGFGAGLLVAWAFDLQGVARGVVILQSSMPVAVFNFLFAQWYDNRPSDVAGTVVISTALAFLILPALLWFVLEGP